MPGPVYRVTTTVTVMEEDGDEVVFSTINDDTDIAVAADNAVLDLNFFAYTHPKED